LEKREVNVQLSDMKRVLIIANLAHSSPRIPGLAAFLPDYGWECSILTPPFSQDVLRRIIDSEQFLRRTTLVFAPFSGDVFEPLRRIIGHPSGELHESTSEKIHEKIKRKGSHRVLDHCIRLLHMLFAYPDTETPWIRSALCVARKHLASHHYDAILSSSPFPTNHIIANQLKKEFSLPWCADYRDPWTQNHTYDFPSIRKIFEVRLEQKILSSANAVVAAAPSYAKKQKSILKRDVQTITNGFDPLQYTDTPSVLDKKLSIVYTGTIYPGKQNPLPFFDAIQELINRKLIDSADISVTFYGKNLQWLLREIDKRELSSVVSISYPLSHKKIIERQKSAQLLLLLGWEDKNNPGVYPSKLFEYLGARRPILLVGGSEKEDIKKIISRAHAGTIAIGTDEIMRVIQKCYSSYRAQGSIPYGGSNDVIAEYSWPYLAQHYCDILDSITT